MTIKESHPIIPFCHVCCVCALPAACKRLPVLTTCSRLPLPTACSRLPVPAACSRRPLPFGYKRLCDFSGYLNSPIYNVNVCCIAGVVAFIADTMERAVITAFLALFVTKIKKILLQKIKSLLLQKKLKTVIISCYPLRLRPIHRMHRSVRHISCRSDGDTKHLETVLHRMLQDHAELESLADTLVPVFVNAKDHRDISAHATNMLTHMMGAFQSSARTFVLSEMLFSMWYKKQFLVDRDFPVRKKINVLETRIPSIACACFGLACKTVETWAPSLKHLCQVHNNILSPQDIHDCEIMLLQKFSWNINLSTPIDILHQLANISEAKRSSKTLASVFTEAETLAQIIMCFPQFKHEPIGVIAGGCLVLMATMMTCCRVSKKKMLRTLTPAKFISKETVLWSNNVFKHLRMLHDSSDNDICFDFLFKTKRVFLF